MTTSLWADAGLWTGAELPRRGGTADGSADPDRRLVAIPAGFAVVAARAVLAEHLARGNARWPARPEPASTAHLRHAERGWLTMCGLPCRGWAEFPDRRGLLPAFDSCDDCRRAALLSQPGAGPL